MPKPWLVVGAMTAMLAPFWPHGSLLAMLRHWGVKSRPARTSPQLPDRLAVVRKLNRIPCDVPAGAVAYPVVWLLVLVGVPVPLSAAKFASIQNDAARPPPRSS